MKDKIINEIVLNRFRNVIQFDLPMQESKYIDVTLAKKLILALQKYVIDIENNSYQQSIINSTLLEKD